MAGIVICVLAILPGAYLLFQLVILDIPVSWAQNDAYSTAVDSSRYIYLPYLLAAIAGLVGLVVCPWRLWSIRLKLKAFQQRPGTTSGQE